MAYDDYVDDLLSSTDATTDERFVAKQLLKLHREAKSRERVTILELGVDQGQSTRVFLNAIAQKEHSALVSVDVRDCSDVVTSDQWQFVRSDSADVEHVVGSAPVLKEGIDVLYVDSLHTADHVSKEVYGYYPYLNEGAVIFFDDIDSLPYVKGGRKDNALMEISNRDIMDLVEAIFLANTGELDLTVYRGSTGLARLEKQGKARSTLSPPQFHRKRVSRLLYRLLYRLGMKPSYRHAQY